MLYINFWPSVEYKCITDVALFTMIRQMAGYYVHATHSLFYDAYYADIFSLLANHVMVKKWKFLLQIRKYRQKDKLF